jgi:outer membrane protein OmpA-like peptidoglycan-associated protein
MDLGLLTDILQSGDELRRNALDRYGPIAPIITSTIQVATGGFALVTFLFGTSFMAPPEPLKAAAVRVASLTIAIGIAALMILSRDGGSAWTFLRVALAGLIIGLVGVGIYLYLSYSLLFKCDQDPADYMRGFRLNPNAAKVLAGVYVGLPPAYLLKSRPIDQFDFFCNCGKNPNMIWGRASQNLAKVCLIFAYLLFAVPLVLAVASAATALGQPEIHTADKVITLPGDVLFDYNKSELRPGAAVSLDETAKVMRQRGVTTARIEGHTDSIGSDAFNRALSMRRAETVRTALASRLGLDKVKFTIDGLGASQSVAPNDSDANRAKNRRVTILLDR